jgi:hypothetical protein
MFLRSNSPGLSLQKPDPQSVPDSLTVLSSRDFRLRRSIHWQELPRFGPYTLPLNQHTLVNTARIRAGYCPRAQDFLGGRVCTGVKGNKEE